ncbi:hypothetical protein SSS_04108 [Sarcoptes scabiei]|nr:hypothetical protein SSS_04108 [Sarcoptes scabiei]
MNSDTKLIDLADKHRVSASILLRHLLNKITKNKDETKKWLKNPNYCHNPRLAMDIMLINLHDVMEGTISNQISLNSGLMFESEIAQVLRQEKISFMTEEELRAKNYDVTPDFRLNLPLILFEIEQERPINDSVQRNERKSLCLSRCQDFQKKHLGQWNESNDKLPMMITWIECKAFFASTECHKEYYQNQYYSYINRFGDGLVLYKYGFVDEIPKNFLQNIHIAEKLPIFV